MKLSHLSLAIFSAIALAACGGSSSNGDHTMPDQGQNPDQNQGGNTDQNNNTDQESVAKEDADIVDPTKDKVVDAITLSKTSTTASQQYIRGATSVHDRIVNPSNATPASATALSGITLDVQNPNLTNIVIGRIEGKNAKGEDVKIAQYLGSLNTDLPFVSKDSNALQSLNAPNALVQGRDASVFGWSITAGNDFISDSENTVNINPLFTNVNISTQLGNIADKQIAYDAKVKAYNDKAKQIATSGAGDTSQEKGELDTAIDELKQAIDDYNAEVNKVRPSLQAVKVGNTSDWLTRIVSKSKLDTASTSNKELEDGDYEEISLEGGPDTKKLARFGYGLYPFAVKDNSNTVLFNPLYSGNDNGWGDVVNPQNGSVTGVGADSSTNAGQPTHGLVGIYNFLPSNNTPTVVVRGDEDNNVRTTRIFGHLYRDPNDFGRTATTELSNSWERPATFITEVDATGKPTAYGFGAKPLTLDHVQYGRVTAEIGDTDLANFAGTSDWYKVPQKSVERDPAKLADADDFYFYRGTGATTVEQMAAISPDTQINYRGHALMYGIDNKFHGGGQELPNAFGSTGSYGLGNFVEATLDMGAKKFSGSVYNSWHSPEQKAGKNDTLVTFSGDVTGNTVIGHAERTYVTETKPADLRASFYGAQASEVGGAFNSVVRQDPFGPIGWGGVFGAKRVASGGNQWLVSSEDK